MPLVLVVGPAGGHAPQRAAELEKLLSSSSVHVKDADNDDDVITDLFRVQVVSDFSVGVLGRYGDSHEEKTSRARVKEEVARLISGQPEKILICQSLGLLFKGFRYELFCLARTEKTSCLLLYCDDDNDNSCGDGSGSSDSDGLYSDSVEGVAGAEFEWDPEVLQELRARFEVPSMRNKWERLLFTVRQEDEPICGGKWRRRRKQRTEPERDGSAEGGAADAAAADAAAGTAAAAVISREEKREDLAEGEESKERGPSQLGHAIIAALRGSAVNAKGNEATNLAAPVALNFVHELDTRTQAILSVLLRELQASGGTGLRAVRARLLPHVSQNAPDIRFPPRLVTPVELRRMRMQFVQVQRANPGSVDMLGDRFVDFLNTHLS